jgi:hypothetical protein
MSDHPRNFGPMQRAMRCGARTRSGAPCQSPAVGGKARCRMHGGKSSGAPRGNRNALRHGLYTKEVLARGAKVRDLCRRLRATVGIIESSNRANDLDKV